MRKLQLISMILFMLQVSTALMTDEINAAQNAGAIGTLIASVLVLNNVEEPIHETDYRIHTAS